MLSKLRMARVFASSQYYPQHQDYASSKGGVEKLQQLREAYKGDPRNVDKVRRYVRELNRNGQYIKALKVAHNIPQEQRTKELKQQVEYTENAIFEKMFNSKGKSKEKPEEAQAETPQPVSSESKDSQYEWLNSKWLWVGIWILVSYCYDWYKKRKGDAPSPPGPPKPSTKGENTLAPTKPSSTSSSIPRTPGQLAGLMSDIGDMKKPGEVTQRLSDVKGITEITGEINDIIDTLKNREEYLKKGATLPRGIMLYGKPGTGKTLIARAMAGEAGVTFFHYTGSQFDELLVGVGARRVRDMFERAKKHRPCILFIDEIDTLLAKQRRQVEHSSSSATINEFLSYLDGFEGNEMILVVGATNDIDALDSAALRPGRFDYKIHVPLPDASGREEIFKLYTDKIAHDASVEMHKLALMTPGFTGAEIENLVNLAITRAVNADKQKKDMNDRPAATMEDFEYARDRILMGLERKALSRSERQLLDTAVHEAGHAVVTYYTQGPKAIYKSTIVARGDKLGGTYNLPKEKEQFSLTRDEMKQKICVLLGGHKAEKHFLGEGKLSTNCTEDLKKATDMAYSMVRRFGMEEEKFGLISAPKEALSQAGNAKVDDAVRNIINEASNYAEQLIKEHETEVKTVAQKLFQYEYLTGEEIEAVINGRAIKKKVVREKVPEIQ